MLRIIGDTYGKSFSKDINNINIQRTSFNSVCSSNENLESFKRFVEQYIKNKDEIVILTLDSKISNAYSKFVPLFNDDKIKVINTSLPMGAMEIVIKTIVNNKDKNLDSIQKDINKLSEILNSCYFILSESHL